MIVGSFAPEPPGENDPPARAAGRALGRRSGNKELSGQIKQIKQIKQARSFHQICALLDFLYDSLFVKSELKKSN